MHDSEAKTLTQSNAFDSRAHTRGHSSGVTVVVSRAANSASTSFAMLGASIPSRLLFTGSVVDVQESHSVVRELNAPVCGGCQWERWTRISA